MEVWWIVILILKWTFRVHCDYECTMQSFEVTCSKIKSDELSGDVYVTLNKTDIVSLNLTKCNVPSISKETFKDFINLQTLYIMDSGVRGIENDAFSACLDLKELYLGSNKLSSFNALALSHNNKLQVLDLSDNFISDLSDFNVSYFSKLRVLSVANNMLHYLPVDLVIKIQQQTEFYLVIENNPWNCHHTAWSSYVDSKLTSIFCENQNHSTSKFNTEVTELATEFPTTQNSKTTGEDKELTTLLSLLRDSNETENSTNENLVENNQEPNCAKCSFYLCIFWFGGGIWIGIIVGNIGKIKNLLCAKPKTYTDQSAQCDNYIVETRLGNKRFLDLSRNIPLLPQEVQDSRSEEIITKNTP